VANVETVPPATGVGEGKPLGTTFPPAAGTKAFGQVDDRFVHEYSGSVRVDGSSGHVYRSSVHVYGRSVHVYGRSVQVYNPFVHVYDGAVHVASASVQMLQTSKNQNTGVV
jgi:hypothetical protein